MLLPRLTPAELRVKSEVLLAHARKARAEAEVARLQAIECQARAEIARASAEARRIATREVILLKRDRRSRPD
jgi:hypothetical protein